MNFYRILHIRRIHLKMDLLHFNVTSSFSRHVSLTATAAAAGPVPAVPRATPGGLATAALVPAQRGEL